MVELGDSELDQKVKNLLEIYKIGDFKQITRIKSGYTNQNYKLQTTQSTYILRICNPSFSKNQLLEEIYLKQLLKSTPFKTCHPIKSEENEYLQQIDNSLAIIYEFIEGEEPIPNKNNCYEVGLQIAQLAFIQLPLQLQRKMNVYTFENSLLFAEKMQKENLNEKFPRLSSYFEYFKEQTDYLNKNGLIKDNLPKGLVHGDVYADNTIFIGDQLQAIIDMDEFYYGYFIFEIASTINGFCFNEKQEINFDLIKFLIKGYQEVRKLEEEEKDCLYLNVQWAAHAMTCFHLTNLVNDHVEKSVIDKTYIRLDQLIQRVQQLRKIDKNYFNQQLL